MVAQFILFAALATTFQLLMWAGYSRLHRPHAVRHLDTLLRRQRAHERTAGLRLPTHSRDVARQVTRECGD